MIDKPDDITEDLKTVARAVGIEMSAVEAYVKACEAGDWDAAEKHRQEAHDSMDAMFDALATAHRMLHGLGGK